MGTPTLSLLLIYLSLLVSVVHVAADSRPRPGTRLAAWSSVVDENGNVKACDVSKDKAKDRDAIVPRFYYQGIDNGIYEISWVPSNKNTGGSWSAPYLIVSPNDAAPNTPLAVVYYRLGSSTRLKLWFVGPLGTGGSYGPLRVRGYVGGGSNGWGNVEDVGATVYVSQSFASSISASYSGGGEFGIWYQSDPSTIKCCRYDDVGGAQCKAQPDAGPLNNVHDGTGIAFHVDDAGHWHIWYQSNQPPYPIQEYYYGGEAWSIGVVPGHESAPPGAQIAAMTGAFPTGAKYKHPNRQVHLFQSNDMIYNYLTESVNAGGCDLGYNWCSPQAVAWVKNFNAGIAVTGCALNMRAYYVTADSDDVRAIIGELTATSWGVADSDWDSSHDPPYWATGWYTTVKNVLGTA